jgi:SNF2 family DNA or RNA helicase
MRATTLRLKMWRKPTQREIDDNLVWVDNNNVFYTMIYYMPFLTQSITEEVREKLHDYVKFRNFRKNPPPTNNHSIATCTPYQHQLTGRTFLRNNNGVLADTVGLGKTFTSYDAFLTKDSKVLVICEKSKKLDWAKEATDRFDVWKEEIGVVQSGSKQARINLYKKTPKILIITYDILLRDSEFLITIMPEYSAIIADEAHRFKNIDSLTRKELNYISLPHLKRAALTATPHETSLMELYSICQWACPDFFPPENLFYNRYVTFDHYSNPILNKKKSELEYIFSQCILRRTWDDIDLDLPPIQSHVIKHGMSQAQKDLYNKYYRASLNATDDQRLGYYSRMLSTCLSPIVVKKEGESEKKNTFLHLITPLLAKGENLVCFTRSKRFINHLCDTLSHLNPVSITGDVDTAGRDQAILKFGKTTQLIFINSAGERGLNLQQGTSVINIDVPSNPARFRQRAGRILRLGQKAESLSVYSLVAEGTIEESLLTRCVQRSHQFDQFVQRGKRDTLSSVLASLKPSDVKLKS